jgi:hypothetical protein
LQTIAFCHECIGISFASYPSKFPLTLSALVWPIKCKSLSVTEIAMIAQLTGVSQFLGSVDQPTAQDGAGDVVPEQFASVLGRVTSKSRQEEGTGLHSAMASTSDADLKHATERSSEAAETILAPAGKTILKSKSESALHEPMRSSSLSQNVAGAPTKRSLLSPRAALVPDGSKPYVPSEQSGMVDTAEVSVPAAKIDDGMPTSIPSETSKVLLGDKSGNLALDVSGLISDGGRRAQQQPTTALTSAAVDTERKLVSSEKGGLTTVPKKEVSQAGLVQDVGSAEQLAGLVVDASDKTAVASIAIASIPLPQPVVFSSRSVTERSSGVDSPLPVKFRNSLPQVVASTIGSAPLVPETSGGHTALNRDTGDRSLQVATASQSSQAGVVIASDVSVEASALLPSMHVSSLSAQIAHTPAVAVEMPNSAAITTGSEITPSIQDSGHALPMAVLRTTPTSLEVGVSSGTHGWLKIRAEITTEGGVSASLAGSSRAAEDGLRKDLPALNSYLQSEKVAVSALAIVQVPGSAQGGSGNQPELMLGTDLNGGHAGLTAGMNGGNSQPERGAETPGRGTDQTDSRVTSGVAVAKSQRDFGLGDSTAGSPVGYGSGGSWLDVRV